ncbi:metallophosphoesterase family protein [Vibrio echinoideorum]|uniref:metallophosphoesterase family protein n=1 Tax=Vibrio echinoideorum TaxID=2100116 RepID=UPI001081FE45|nr:metallophosphoesterase family protein [Vibrio echinoideorum]
MKSTIYLLSCLFAANVLAQSNIKFDAPEVNENTVQFAIIGDLTGGERTGVYSDAVNALTLMQPDFILSVGDLIEGGTEKVVTMNSEWKVFADITKRSEIPFYPVVGNHDISNTKMRDWWESTIGPRYYHFRHRDLLFLMLDSEDFTAKRFNEIKTLRNEAVELYKTEGKEAFAATEYARLKERKYGQISDEQLEYFLDALEENKDVKWVFVLMHKPLWSDTSSGFVRLEHALQDFSYTVMNGHEHTYYYEEKKGRDYIQLATTGGALTPSSRGFHMDHIMWISIDDKEPKIINLKLEGLMDKYGKPILTTIADE